MKNIIVFICLVFISINLYAQDLIIRNNGDRIKCRIIKEDSLSVYFELDREDEVISTQIYRNEIKSIRRKNSIKEGNSQLDKVSLALGFGVDYSILGANVLAYPTNRLGVFVGIGYEIFKPGLSVGLKYKFPNSKPNAILQPYLLGMYGPAVLVRVRNISNLDKVFNGILLGAGLDYYPRRSLRGYWSFGLNCPINPNQADDYMTKLKREYNIRFNERMLPFSISVGYRIILNHISKY